MRTAAIALALALGTPALGQDAVEVEEVVEELPAEDDGYVMDGETWHYRLYEYREESRHMSNMAWAGVAGAALGGLWLGMGVGLPADSIAALDTNRTTLVGAGGLTLAVGSGWAWWHFKERKRYEAKIAKHMQTPHEPWDAHDRYGRTGSRAPSGTPDCQTQCSWGKPCGDHCIDIDAPCYESPGRACY